jgi:hypothetical protein
MNKLTEVIAVSPAASWVAMASYRQFTGIGALTAADDGEGISVQLRKATSAAGANAADHGTAVTAASTATNTDISAMVSAFAADLGETAGGVRFTHVTATVTLTGSPAATEELSGIVIRSDGRFSE